MGLTARPTPEFRRQHDVEEPRVDERAFRQGFLVRTRFDQLLADRRISRGEWQAADEYRQTYETANARVAVEPGMSRIAGSSSADEAAIARIDAETKLRIVETAIGKLATALVVACVIEDMTWASIARHCKRHPETVRDWTVLSIRALAAAWETPQAARTTRTPKSPRQRVTAL